MKRGKLNKLSKREIPKLHRELWEVFSPMIKNRDKWTCITCSKKGDGQAMNAGHFKPQGTYPSIKYDTKNVHAQCSGCNKWKHGMLDVYSEKMIEKYGQDILKELSARAKLKFDYTPQRLMDLTDAAYQGIKKFEEVYESMRPKMV